MFTHWLILVMRNLRLIMLSSIRNFENSKRESKKWIWPNLFSTQVVQISELKIETKVNRIVDTVRAIFNANANTVLISNKRHCQITFMLNSNPQSHRRVGFFFSQNFIFSYPDVIPVCHLKKSYKIILDLNAKCSAGY